MHSPDLVIRLVLCDAWPPHCPPHLDDFGKICGGKVSRAQIDQPVMYGTIFGPPKHPHMQKKLLSISQRSLVDLQKIVPEKSKITKCCQIFVHNYTKVNSPPPVYPVR